MATSVRVIRIPILSDIRASILKWVYSNEQDTLTTAAKIGIALFIGGLIATVASYLINGLLAKFIGYSNFFAILALLMAVFITFWLIDKRSGDIENELKAKYILGVLFASIFGMIVYYIAGGTILTGMQSILNLFGATPVAQSLLMYIKSLMLTQSLMLVTSQGVVSLPIFSLGAFMAYPAYYFIYLIEELVLKVIGLKIE